MFYSRNLLFGKGKYLWGLTLFLVISVICVAFSLTGSNDFEYPDILPPYIKNEISLFVTG